MSEFIAHRPITSIRKHPNADSLAILEVGAFTVVHNLKEAEQLKVGQMVTHFPTDICIHPTKAVELGVHKYLRDVRYKDDLVKSPCRIVAARLRGTASYGFINLDTSVPDAVLDEHYGAWKYEPPELPANISGEKEREDHAQFPRYTKIKRIQLYPDVWTDGLPVRVTEKLHGTNIRMGVVTVDGEWRFMVGSHNVIVREFNTQTGARNKYWEMLDGPVMTLLNSLCDGERPVIVYGEMLGRGIQDLDYGFEEPTLRVFDVMVGGQYLDWELVKAYCDDCGVATVPLLYEGRFSWQTVNQLTDGGSTINDSASIKSKFKGREGIVITPLQETYMNDHPMGGRLIAKSVSADYESRRDGTEYH